MGGAEEGARSENAAASFCRMEAGGWFPDPEGRPGGGRLHPGSRRRCMNNLSSGMTAGNDRTPESPAAAPAF